MYIDRPKLLEEIRKSILHNNITYIFGYVGSGKTTICKECLKTYFNHIPVHVIYPYMPDTELKIDSFAKEIYVFEDCDCEFKDIITSLDYIASKVGAKFILISRKIIHDNRINVIDVNTFDVDFNKIVDERLKKIYNHNIHKLAEDIAKFTDVTPELYSNISELILSTPFKRSDEFDVIYKPCIVDVSGNPIEKVDETTKIIVTEINDELLYELSKKPELLHSLSSYEFERIVARMFEKQGFSVEITPKTRDGGKDIFVVKQGLGSFLFYVECKKYAPDKPVGIGIIQRLYGVISAEKANGGFIATTSYFTKPAKDYIQEHNLDHRLTLQDYNTISNTLKSLRYNIQ